MDAKIWLKSIIVGQTQFFRYKSHGYIGSYYLEWSETDQTSQLPNHLEKMAKFVDIWLKIIQKRH